MGFIEALGPRVGDVVAHEGFRAAFPKGHFGFGAVHARGGNGDGNDDDAEVDDVSSGPAVTRTPGGQQSGN